MNKTQLAVERLRKARDAYRDSSHAEIGTTNDLIALCNARGRKELADNPVLRYEFALDSMKIDYTELLASVDAVLDAVGAKGIEQD